MNNSKWVLPSSVMTMRFHKNSVPLKYQRLDAAMVGAGERRVISVSGCVIEVGEDFVWAATNSKSACAHCSERQGCGVSALSNLIGRRSNRIRVPNSMNASLGDEVILGVRETALLKSTFMLYLLPLLSMLIFALAINVMVNNEALTVLAAGCGLLAGFAVVRYFAARNASDNTLQPFMLRCKKPERLSESK